VDQDWLTEDREMSNNFESWALIWLFCIAVGTCNKPDTNVYVDGKKVTPDKTNYPPDWLTEPWIKPKE